MTLRFDTAAAMLVIGLVICWGATGAAAQDLTAEPPYTITGYSFDYDAVLESESGIFFETSRFKPLMITNSTADIFGDDPFGTGFAGPAGQPGPRGFAIAAEYLPTPGLAFHGAIGVTSSPWEMGSSAEAESSWEANIGVVYNFFNSLSYEIHFGYMETGDLFQQVDTYSDVDSIIMISNQLTLSF